MSKIAGVHAREILDSRGNPTVEAVVLLESGHVGVAGVPSGASTGAYEAHELRDGDKKRYMGKGVKKAIQNIKEVLAPAIIGMDPTEFEAVDEKLIDLDGTDNKSKLGANAILGVSLAAAKAAAMAQNLPLFVFLGGRESTTLPVPLMNVLNGGAHANNGLDCQEFMLAPVMDASFSDALRAGAETFQHLKKILSDKGLSTAVGDEGGFAPKLSSNREALELLSAAVEKAGYKVGEDFVFALDVASTELFKKGKYSWEGKQLSASELGEVYSTWSKDFPIQSIEDGFAEDDWEGWTSFTESYGSKIQLVGDDLFVTNPKRFQEGIDKQAGNAILIKVNQIGTLTETTQAIKLAKKNGYRTVMSHRSGETEDTTIAELSVGLNTDQIKTGSLCRGERTAKYNQLLRIEESLGSNAKYLGKQAFGMA